MLLLPIPLPSGKLNLLIVLEDANLERIKQHDCAEVNWRDLREHALRAPDKIGVGYVNPEERERLYKMAKKGDMAGCLRLVTGGFQHRPEEGDGALPTKLNPDP